MVAQRARLSAAALAVACMLAGCATGVPPVPPGEPRAPDAPGSTGREPGALGTAAGALVAQGVSERRAGDYGRAAATLERALRIEPASPTVWLELARVRLAQGDYAQARQLALKAESLAEPGSPLVAECRALEAEARRRAGQGS